MEPRGLQTQRSSITQPLPNNSVCAMHITLCPQLPLGSPRLPSSDSALHWLSLLLWRWWGFQLGFSLFITSHLPVLMGLQPVELQLFPEVRETQSERRLYMQKQSDHMWLFNEQLYRCCFNSFSFFPGGRSNKSWNLSGSFYCNWFPSSIPRNEIHIAKIDTSQSTSNASVQGQSGCDVPFCCRAESKMCNCE